MNQAERRIRERQEREALCRKQDQVVLFQGENSFTLLINHPRERRFYRLVDLEAGGEELLLPGSYGGLPIREADLTKRTFPRVKTLSLPGELDNLRLQNDTFPSLERVLVAPKSPYSTDGRMLYRESGTRLVYALRQAYARQVVIPRQVKRIGRYAFVGGTFESLVVENREILVEVGAFDGSLWEESQQVVIVGSLLYRVRSPLSRLQVPEGVTRFMEGCFLQHCPRRLALPFFPRVSQVFPWGEASGELKELEITGREALFSLRDLFEWKKLEGILLPEDHRDYRAREGVVFSRDGKKLLFYPRQRRGEEYTCGEQVEEIGEEAFAGNPYLTFLHMGEGVRRVGQRAFAGCSALKGCELSPGISSLPGAGIGNVYDGGLFADCTELSQVKLPRDLEEIGEYVFRGTRVKTLTLPEGIKKVKRGALWGVTSLWCLQGRAKGLVTGLLPYGKIRPEPARIYYEGREEGGYLLIPREIKEKGLTALEEAWNGERISFEAYERAFWFTPEGTDRQEMALLLTLERERRRKEEIGAGREEGIEADREEGIGDCRKEEKEAGREEEKEEGYLTYLKSHALSFAKTLLWEEQTQILSRLLPLGLLSSGELLSLLELANEKGDTKAAAYLLAFGASREEGDRFWL